MSNKVIEDNQKKCFMIGPIGSGGTDLRANSDKLFEVCRFVFASEYAVFRADHIPEQGMITNQIIENLISSDIVIADLTGHNPNVFYELAIRHAADKPVVHLMEKKDFEFRGLPFDLKQQRTIIFDGYDDKQKISLDLETQKNLLNGNGKLSFQNPITNVYHALLLRESQEPSDKIVLQIYEKIDDLRKSAITNDNIGDFVNSIKKAEKNIDVEYIAGKDEAFKLLTGVIRNAKNDIRITRYFPQPILEETQYIYATQDRILGTDGRPPLSNYYKIMATNQEDKYRDLLHHMTHFIKKPFKLYLTDYENSFELVIVDETDAFIHLYNDPSKKEIAITLHIKTGPVVKELKILFDHLRNDEKTIKKSWDFVSESSLPHLQDEIQKYFFEKNEHMKKLEVDKDKNK
ncbi:MAG: hypothetical protein WA821_07320 [Anaerolineales bacterium]